MNDQLPGGNQRARDINGYTQHLPVAAAGHELAQYNPYTQHPESLDDDTGLRRLWRIASKYRWLIATTVTVAVVTTLVANLLMRPVYRASALIEVKPEQRVVIELENVQQMGRDAGYLNTQKRILTSSSIARTVVEESNLVADPEFTGELGQRGLSAGLAAVKQGIIDAFSALASTMTSSDHGRVEAADGSAEATGDAAETRSDDAGGQKAIANRYMRKLSVEEVRNSNLLRISFDSFSAEKAARLANVHATTFIRVNNQRRFNSTSSAKDFLTKQIKQAQAQLEASEKALTDFARNRNIVDVEDRSNVMETRLSELNSALTKTRNQRIVAQVEYQQIREGNLEGVPVDREGALLADLRQRYNAVKTEYAEMSKIFKDTYPEMKQLKSRMNSIKEMLDEERRNFAGSLKQRYERLLAQEQELSERVEAQREKLLDLKDRAISYNILKREWEANKQLYTGLLEKQKDVSVAAGMEKNNIEIVDKATVPSGKYLPRTKQNVAKAGVFGLVGGFALAFLLSFLDNTFKTREDLENALGLMFLGLVPKTDNSKIGGALMLLSQHEPMSPFAEAMRSIRTNVLFSRPESVPKTLLVTSTTAEEGKSTTTTNLASILAQNGARVLIMETDLRKPNLAGPLGIDKAPGLADYLNGLEGEFVKATPFDNVYCVPAGGPVSQPAELLGSPRMDDYLASLARHFDFIVLDGPPILGLADSMVMSNKVDGVLLVVKAASTEKEAVQEAVKRLRTVNAPVIGSILNYVDFSKREYGYYKKYYYGYGYRDGHKEGEQEPQLT